MADPFDMPPAEEPEKTAETEGEDAGIGRARVPPEPPYHLGPGGSAGASPSPLPDEAASEIALPSAPGASVRGSVATAVALVVILLVAAAFRLTGVNWDSGTHIHPDERFISMVEGAISWPHSLAEYFDTARSPLNPYNRGFNSFVYGTFPLFLVKWIGDQLGMGGYEQVQLVGRAVSALFDVGSVLLIFLIGCRLYDRRAGLLAALLTAATVTSIQQSHFFTFDTFTVFFLLAAFLFTVRIWQAEHWYDYLLLGGSLGFALACKVNSAVFALVVALVALKRLRDVTIDPGEEADRVSAWIGVVSRFALAAVTALVVFRVVEPYAFAGPGFFNLGLSKKFLDDMGYVQKLVSGEIDQPPSVQWAGTTPYLFPLVGLVDWGMGIPLGVVAWAGLLFAAYRLLVKKEERHLLIVAWVAFFFWYQGGQFAKTMRYFLPIVPLLCLLGAHLMLKMIAAARWRGERIGVAATAARRLARYGAVALIALVVVSTLAYAVAFTSIYTRPLTRIAATEWIFANIPRGTAIKNEHWDDPLPLRWQGRDAGWYNGGDLLPLYDEDTPQKLDKLASQLDTTQYIFMSSDRLSYSIPRMPMKYPMTTEYYRLLFSGQLGFKLVKSFTSYPALFGLQLNDDASEEIFRNYDHPKVLIFQKTADYSGARVRQLLGAALRQQPLRIRSVDASYDGLLLDSQTRQVDEQGGTWSQLYDRQSLPNRLPTLSWLLVLELLGLLALPLTWRVFARFQDGGYGLAKVLGLVMVAYVAWLIPSLRLLPFGPAAILVGVALLSAASAAVLVANGHAFGRFLSAHWRTVVVHEALFLGAFLLFYLIRLRNPDLWHLNFGGEKPMEFAYLNAVAKSSYFPPYDPWMAGGYINYYYFGFVIVATLIRLTGIVPSVAFNLAIPSIFALTAAGLFSFGFNYALRMQRQMARLVPGPAVLTGLATAALVLVVGNLDGPIQILEGLWRAAGPQFQQFKSTLPFLEGGVKAAAGAWAVVLGGKTMPVFDFWRSTRVIGPESPGPISEFPYFTFLYGDLHPHMIAMPLGALALALVLAIVWQGARKDAEMGRRGEAATGGRGEAATGGRGDGEMGGQEEGETGRRRGGVLKLLVSERALAIYLGGLVVGMLEATNTWDYPTYLLLLSVAFLLSAYARDREVTLRGITEALLSAGATYLVGALLFLPYTRAYQLFYSGVDPAPAKTSIQQYLVIFGFFVFCLGSVMLIDIARNRWHRFWARSLWEQLTRSPRASRRRELAALLARPTPWMELLPYAALTLVGIVLAAAVLKLYLVSLLVLLGTLALLCLFDRDRSPERMLLALFVGLAVALTLMVEFVTIKGDIGRMNTVFKFYLQAWFLFGIASALGVAGVLWRWNTARGKAGSAWRSLWVAALVVMVAGVLVYPVQATPVKVGLRFQPLPDTLDGMAYMEGARFKEQNNTDIVLANDCAGITWLQNHVAGSPVVLEAQIPEYRWGSRISIYTGLPTVLGWTWHQRQQRSAYQYMIEDRLRDIKTMYESTDTTQVAALLHKYDVSLIYVGDLERAYYSPAGLTKFDQMVGKDLSVVYRANGVAIYEVKRDGTASVILP